MMINEFLEKKKLDLFPSMVVAKRCRERYPYVVDLKHPKTFNEKIKWLSTHYRNPLYTRCADKVEIYGFVVEKLGKEEADELFCEKYGIWEKVEDIDFDSLPSSFVLKSNHASGHIIICEDKNKLDWEKTQKTLNKWLHTNFFYVHGEWQYKNIKPKIICERLLDSDIVDYRIFCFAGKPEYIKVTKHNSNSAGGYDCGLYYTDWTEADFSVAQNYGNLEIEKPADLENMLRIAKALSANFCFVRVDLYSVSGKTYFAELTFTPNAGYEFFSEYETDLKFGEKITLPIDRYVTKW